MAGETLEATITGVLETWPLQLVVDANGKRYDLRLTEQATVVRRGRALTVRELRPGLRIRFAGRQGTPSRPTALVVERIEVL
jgi:hypothetical protein